VKKFSALLNWEEWREKIFQYSTSLGVVQLASFWKRFFFHVKLPLNILFHFLTNPYWTGLKNVSASFKPNSRKQSKAQMLFAYLAKLVSLYWDPNFGWYIENVSLIVSSLDCFQNDISSMVEVVVTLEAEAEASRYEHWDEIKPNPPKNSREIKHCQRWRH